MSPTIPGTPTPGPAADHPDEQGAPPSRASAFASRCNAPMSHTARKRLVILAGTAAVLLVLAFAWYVTSRPGDANNSPVPAPTEQQNHHLSSTSAPVGGAARHAVWRRHGPASDPAR